MKVASAVAVILLLGAGGAAEAAQWWPTKRLPKAIDTPYLRPKMRDSHKPGNKQNPPPQAISAVLPAGATATA